MIRRIFLLASSYQSGLVFEGGAGGLSKKKPDVGVVLADQLVDRVQLLASSGKPVDVAFEAPWPTNGLSARDLSTGDSAFIAVGDELSIFNKEGRYGAYGPPSDIVKVGPGEYTFDALTPSMREVRRHVKIRTIDVDDHFMLVVGCTEARWKKMRPVLDGVLASFTATPAPLYDANMKKYLRSIEN